jgi:hypothetical protein
MKSEKNIYNKKTENLFSVGFYVNTAASDTLLTQKTFESTVPKVSWRQEGAVLECNDQQTPVTITEAK